MAVVLINCLSLCHYLVISRLVAISSGSVFVQVGSVMTLYEVSVMDSVSVSLQLSRLFNGATLLSGKELDEFPHPTLLIVKVNASSFIQASESFFSAFSYNICYYENLTS